MDISLLRKKPQDRLRTVFPFGGPEETAEVLFCGREEMAEVQAVAKRLLAEGLSKDDAYNVAYGRVALRGWSGLVDGDEPLSFNDENSDLLMIGSAEFRTAVIVAATSLRPGLEKN
jgi:hypothetical protein